MLSASVGHACITKRIIFVLLATFLDIALTGCLDTSSTELPSTGSDPAKAPSSFLIDPSKCQGAMSVAVQGVSGASTSYMSIQEAVNAATAGQIIWVGSGVYNELIQLTAKSGITLQTNCSAQVKGFAISSSSNLTIQGFVVDGKSSGADGISFAGSTSASKNVNISQVEIRNVSSGFSGITINNSCSGIQVSRAYIHDNKGVGIYLSGKDIGLGIVFPGNNGNGPNLISQNSIQYNGLDGLVVDGKQTVTLDSNDIIANGQAGQTQDGYGLKIANAEDASLITLTKDVIAFNNGQVKPGTATRDIYQPKKIFTVQDSGNLTTSGAEGISVTKFTSTTPPIITFSSPSGIYTNKPSFSFNVGVNDLAPVTSKIYQNGTFLFSTNLIAFNVNGTLQELNNIFKVVSTDAFGNTATSQISIYLDTTPPKITLGVNDNVLTNKPSFSIPVTVVDDTATLTTLLQNGRAVATTNQTSHTFNVILVEGVNTFQISSNDLAGNQTIVKLNSITLDTIPPVLSNIVPANGATVSSLNFTITGNSDEPLSSATVNGKAMTLSADKLSFSALYTALSEGILALQIVATDLAGNPTTINENILVSTKALYPNLITVQPDPSGSGKLFIIGMAGAARPGITVNAKAGVLFNTGSSVAATDGSFKIALSYFTSATVSAFNDILGITESTVVSYKVSTSLAGLVLDTSGTPLPGATVSLGFGGGTVTTANDGSFSFTNMSTTGDNLLTIDGRTIPQSVTGNLRTFSLTRISVNIGVGQANVLPRPVYLAPLMMDGTQTTISNGAGSTVTSPNAPGVSLAIPSGAVTFPNGSNSGSINMSVVQSSRTTIPPSQVALPDTVVSLEPSGTSFNTRVPLVLPNDNNLPEGVQLIILSHNSQKGKWEIDGNAKIQGGQVVTLPGQGISHFSEIYAVPLGLVIKQVNNPEVSGVDTFNGALTTSISLPSFKSLGQDVAPKLTYKSTWAKPTAVITNYLDLPTQKVTFPINSSGDLVVPDHLYASGTYCDPFGGECVQSYELYYDHVHFQSQTTVTSWYQPQSITGSFYANNFSSSTGAIDFNSPTVKAQFQGSPSQVVVSYAVEFKDPVTGKYLDSGIYPGLAHYDVKLAHMTMSTTTTIKNSATYGVVRSDPVENSPDPVNEIFPQDLGVNLIVQNKTQSAAGRGWMINGVQKIINPNANRILIEEADGSPTTYALANTISSLYSVPTNGTVDLSEGVDLTRWPKAIVTSFDGKNTQLQSLDLQMGSSYTLGTMKNYTGTFVTDGVESLYVFHCDFSYEYGGVPFCDKTGTWTRNYWPWIARSKTSQVIGLSDGRIFGVDDFQHRLFELDQTGNFKSLLGLQGTTTFDFHLSNGQPEYRDNSTTLTANQYCQNTLGIPCSTSSGSTSCVGSDREINNSFWFANNIYFPPLLVPTNCPDPGNQLAGGMGAPVGQGVNTPKGITASPQGLIVFTDTGNNVVRSFDPNTSSTTIIAGTGSNLDNGDSGLATQASMYHPRGIAYDGQGNLYISTENGLIRKVDSSGYITTVAGKPLNQGGLLVDQGVPKDMYLNMPYGLAFDVTNNFLYIADTGNNRVLRLDFNQNLMSTVAGNGTCDPNIANDGQAALNASVCNPTQVGLDNLNNLVLVDSGHKEIRRVTFQSTQGALSSYSPTNPDLSSLVKNSDGTFMRTYRNGTKISFDSLGHETSSLDRIGNQAKFQYDPNGNLTQMTDPVGQNISYTYSGNQLTSITDPAGRTTRFNYSGNFLSGVVYPDNTSKSFAYSTDGLMTSETNQNGFATQYAYNQWNRLQTVTRADGSSLKVNDSTSATVGNNFTGGSMGQLQSFGAGQGQIADGIVDAKNVSTIFVKDYRGFVTTIVDGAGNSMSIQRDIWGFPIVVTRSDKTTVTTTYDPVTHDTLATTDTATGATFSAKYDQYGNVLTFIDPNLNTTNYTYDQNNGLKLAETKPDGSTITYSYGKNGLLVATHIQADNANALSTFYSYDQFGRLLSTTDDIGRGSVSQLDAAGNALQTSRILAGQTASTYNYNYDAFNRLISVALPSGASTTYAFTNTGKLQSVTDSKNHSITYQYNSIDELTSMADPAAGTKTFTYDKNGNILAETDANGNTKTYKYDLLNRATQLTLPDDQFSFSYDVRGKVTSIQNYTSLLTFSYDSRGKVTRKTSAGLGNYSNLPATSFTYNYDIAGNLVSRSDALLGTEIYGYNTINRLVAVTDAMGNHFNFSYDLAGRLKGLARPGSMTSIALDKSSLLNSIIHSSGATSLSSFVYQYDTAGNEVSSQTLAGTRKLAFDSNSQLLSSQNSDLNQTNFAQESFQYDSLGNRISDANGIYNYDGPTGRLSDDYNFVYKYDNNGNLIWKTPKNTTSDSFGYTYSSENQLISIRVFGPSGQLIVQGSIKLLVTFVYDAMGRRVQKNVIDYVNGNNSYVRRYVYDSDDVVAELDGNNTLLVKHSYSGLFSDDILASDITSNGVAAGLAQNSGTYFYLKDRQGSVIAITDGVGTMLQEYRYSSFGTLVQTLDGVGNNISSHPLVNTAFTYIGRELDRESGLYFVRARYYDPTIGRFLQEDPDAGIYKFPMSVVNKYTYAYNNPSAYLDSTGRLPWWGIVVVAITGGAAGILLAPFALAALGAVGITAAAGSIGALALGAVSGVIAGAIGGWIAGGLVGGAIGSIVGEGFAAGFSEGSFIGAEAGAISGGIRGAKIGYDMGIGKPQTHILTNNFEKVGRNYYNPDTKESLSPDFDHPGMDQHYDWSIRGMKGQWRWFFDGQLELKQGTIPVPPRN